MSHTVQNYIGLQVFKNVKRIHYPGNKTLFIFSTESANMIMVQFTRSYTVNAIKVITVKFSHSIRVFFFFFFLNFYTVFCFEFLANVTVQTREPDLVEHVPQRLMAPQKRKWLTGGIQDRMALEKKQINVGEC